MGAGARGDMQSRKHQMAQGERREAGGAGLGHVHNRRQRVLLTWGFEMVPKGGEAWRRRRTEPYSFSTNEMGLAHQPFAGRKVTSLCLCEKGVMEMIAPPPLREWSWGRKLRQPSGLAAEPGLVGSLFVSDHKINVSPTCQGALSACRPHPCWSRPVAPVRGLPFLCPAPHLPSCARGRVAEQSTAPLHSVLGVARGPSMKVGWVGVLQASAWGPLLTSWGETLGPGLGERG